MSHEVNSKESSLESQLEKNEDDLKMKDSQGGEGVDFDGDIEDSDVEMETHYYPISSENNRLVRCFIRKIVSIYTFLTFF